MVITRFAPSPTGYIHVGNLRTALFNYLIARKNKGTFILRLDDTDQERSKQEYVDGIMEDLEWLGLTWDRVERQSDRLDRYAQAAQDMRIAGRLYEAFETPVELDLKRKKQLNMGKPPVYDRAARSLSDEDKAKLREKAPGHWRFLLDHERIEWADGILGPISIDSASISDPVLIRGDGQFLYTFASVCDDIDFKVTHIVRGADHVTNTGTQIQIMQAMGGHIPSFAHHSLLTGPKGEALSKRLGTLALRDLRAEGVQPMALLSLMARLGSSEPIELRTSLDELIQDFDISTFGAAPTKLDTQDLFPLTARYNAALPYQDVAPYLEKIGIPDSIAPVFWQVLRENITTLGDLEGWWHICRDGGVPDIAQEDQDFVAQAMAILPPPPYTQDTWKEWTTAIKHNTDRKGKALFMPLRKALTGRSFGPDMGALLPLLSHKEP